MAARLGVIPAAETWSKPQGHGLNRKCETLHIMEGNRGGSYTTIEARGLLDNGG